MTAYTDPFSGQTISPATVSYENLTLTANLVLEWPLNGNDTTPAASIIDVTASTVGLDLALPPATQVSPGQTVLVRNIGANAFTVTDNSGASIATIASGIAQYIFLTDNSTAAGVWASVTLGAGVSQANAAALAGNGLTVIGTTLALSHPVTGIFSNYTSSATDRAGFLIWDSGAGTFTLPPSASVGDDWFVILRNGGTGVLTITPQGTDTIDGNATAQLQLTESLVVVCNGSGFNTFGYGRSNQFFYTQLQKVITGGTVVLTSAEAANEIQAYSGALTSNAVVQVPQTVQLYVLTNNTTGGFSTTFNTGAVGGASFVLPQGQTAIVISDGTNLFNASSASVTPGSSLTLANGSQTAPPLNFLGDSQTGLFLLASGTLGFAIGGALGMQLSAAGLHVPVGVAAGTF